MSVYVRKTCNFPTKTDKSALTSATTQQKVVKFVVLTIFFAVKGFSTPFLAILMKEALKPGKDSMEVCSRVGDIYFDDFDDNIYSLNIIGMITLWISRIKIWILLANVAIFDELKR